MKNFYVWGNHHCSNSGNFQKTLDHLVSECTTLPQPLFHVIRNLNNQSICELAANLQSQPTLLVIIVGDSDIEEGIAIEKFLQYFFKLYTLFSYFPLLEVLTCGLISEQNPIFNSGLRQLQSEFSGSFIETEGVFTPDDITPCQQLTDQGGRKLAHLIARNLLEHFPQYRCIGKAG